MCAKLKVIFAKLCDTDRGVDVTWVSFCASICKYMEKRYSGVIMRAMASQITGASIVWSTVCSGTDQRKLQSSSPPAFVRGIPRWPVDSPPHKGPVAHPTISGMCLFWCQSKLISPSKTRFCLCSMFATICHIDINFISFFSFSVIQHTNPLHFQNGQLNKASHALFCVQQQWLLVTSMYIMALLNPELALYILLAHLFYLNWHDLFLCP